MPENHNTDSPYILDEEIPEEDILPDEPDPPVWAGYGVDFVEEEPDEDNYEPDIHDQESRKAKARNQPKRRPDALVNREALAIIRNH